MPERRHRIIQAALASIPLAIVTASAVAAGALDENTFKVQVDAGRVTLEAQKASLSTVIEAIGEQAEFKVRIIGDLTTPVSVTFSDMPLAQALEHLVGDSNRFIVYAPDEPNKRTRRIVQLWLFKSGTVAARPELTTAPDDLQNPDAKLRSLAVLRLAENGATVEVLELLGLILQSDDDPLVRSRAAIALGSLHDASALPALESALNDEHVSVRMQATQALGQIKAEHAVLALGEILLEASDSRQRAVAAASLWRQNTELARSFLDAAADDPDEQVRKAARQAPRVSSANTGQGPGGVEQQGPQSSQ